MTTEERITEIVYAINYEMEPGAHSRGSCSCSRRFARGGKCVLCLRDDLAEEVGSHNAIAYVVAKEALNTAYDNLMEFI